MLDIDFMSYALRHAYELLDIEPPNVELTDMMRTLRKISIDDAASPANFHYHRLQEVLLIPLLVKMNTHLAKRIVTAVSDAIDFIDEEMK